MKLHNVLFPQPDGSNEPLSSRLYDISLVDGVVELIEPASQVEDGTLEDNTTSHLMLPTLCHPHLHLDKAYLLTSGCCGIGKNDDKHVDYSDLLPQTGSFAEALKTTLVAKTRFTAVDLRRRGTQLLATSYAQGVTTARVFVEVDDQAAGRGAVAVNVARELKTLFKGRLDVQICAFAQEVLFTGEAGEAKRAAMEAVLEANHKKGGSSEQKIAALGVTPYVESLRKQSLRNIDWAVTTALKYGLHLDLHLDYNLKAYKGDGSSEDAANEPLLFALLEALIKHNWKDRAKTKTIVVGHATQLTCLTPAQLARLADIIRDNQLPVFFVGLPTSDLYMMGRQPSTSELTSHSTPRGTLPIPALIRQYGLRACLGVNNVGNAFTPYGTGDPLQLASIGVGLYHAGTGPDARLLYGAVSWRAREAIGMAEDGAVDWEKLVSREELVGKRVGPLLAIANPRYIRLPPAAGTTEMDSALNCIPARPRLGFRDIVWDPPDVFLRKVV